MRSPARHFRKGVLASVLLVLAVCAAAAQEPVRIDGLNIPGEVGGFARGPLRDFEAQYPGLGQSVRFSGRPDWTIDAFIYDARLKTIPDDISSSVQREQLTRAKEDILEAERRGFYANVQEGAAFTVGRAGGRRFACAGFNYQRGEKRDIGVDSYLCLTGWKNKFVKLRMSGPRGAIQQADVTKFAEAWISLLSRGR